MTDSRPPRRRRNSGIPTWTLTLVLLCTAPACEVEQSTLADFGSTQLLPVDPGLRFQSIGDDRDVSYQIARWEVTRAMLTVDGGLSYDLLNSEQRQDNPGPCVYIDGSVETPGLFSDCGGGRVIDSSDEAVPVTLELQVDLMEFRRAEPVDLPPMSDFDGDGLINTVDICPIVFDPGQEDDNQDGLGDACSVFSSSALEFVSDADGDRASDTADNCIWISNTFQLDNFGVYRAENEFIRSDQIGDACTLGPTAREQRAVVNVMNAELCTQQPGESNPSADCFLLNLTADVVLPYQFPSLTVVDFNNETTLTACDWNAGVCDLDATLVKLCIAQSVVGATQGCLL